MRRAHKQTSFFLSGPLKLAELEKRAEARSAERCVFYACLDTTVTEQGQIQSELDKHQPTIYKTFEEGLRAKKSDRKCRPAR
jgi:hypothetical protein